MVQINLTDNEAMSLKNWLLRHGPKTISGANSSEASHPLIYKGVGKLAERGGFEPPIQVYLV